MKEIEVLKELNHENIVQLIDFQVILIKLFQKLYYLTLLFKKKLILYLI